MPIYEYFCDHCRTTFSALRPMSQADEIIACVGCDGLQTQRILSLFAVHTRGGAPEPTGAPATGGCACGGGGCGCGH